MRPPEQVPRAPNLVGGGKVLRPLEPHEENLVSTAVWLSQDLLEDGEKMMASGEVVANDHGDDRENGLKELTSRIAYC